MKFLQQFTPGLGIEYFPGRINLPDALSRRIELSSITIASESRVTWDNDVFEQIKIAYANDAEFSNSILCNPIYIKCKQLWYVAESTCKSSKRLVIPGNDKLKHLIMQEAHDNPLGAHLGTTKTSEKIACHFFWSRMELQSRAYVLSSKKCQLNKPVMQRKEEKE